MAHQNTSDLIESYINSVSDCDSELKVQLVARLKRIYDEVANNCPDVALEELDYIVGLQKLIEFITEISENELIGQYEYSVENGLRFVVNSYSVIDYVNAILGDEYIQKGDVFNAEWFGVPKVYRCGNTARYIYGKRD